MAVSLDTIRMFTKRTYFDLSSHLLSYKDFVHNGYPILARYYDGSLDSVPQSTSEQFSELIRDAARLSNIMDNTGEVFDSYDYWELVELADDIKGQLARFAELGRFRRSSRFNILNARGVMVNHMVLDYESPEKVAQRDKVDPYNEWVDFYQKDGIHEIDYKADKGGYYVSINKPNSERLFLYSVVDYMIGEKVYGKDMDANFRYSDNDAFVLSYRETTAQSVRVLSSTMKSEITSDFSIGISPDLLVGNNYGVQSVIFIQRELEEVLSSDDTLKTVVITSVDRVGTTMNISFEVETFYNYTLKQTLEVQ